MARQIRGLQSPQAAVPYLRGFQALCGRAACGWNGEQASWACQRGHYSVLKGALHPNGQAQLTTKRIRVPRKELGL